MSDVKRPGSPAASHMLWFFILPIMALIGFATWKLSTALLNPEELSLTRRLEKLENAVNSGERWKEAYGVSENIHRLKSRGQWDELSVDEKRAVLESLGRVLEQNEADARVSRYLLVTLGQMGESGALPLFEKFFSAKDPELRFFSVWGFSQTVLATGAWEEISLETRKIFIEFLESEDAELQKILTAFLSQGNLADKQLSESLKKLLTDEVREVRWNAAVSLLPKGFTEAEGVLSEMLSLEGLRGADFRSFQDMKQALLAARVAIEKSGNERLALEARKFSKELKGDSPESRAIREALEGL